MDGLQIDDLDSASPVWASIGNKDWPKVLLQCLVIAQQLTNDREYRDRLVSRGHESERVKRMSSIQVVLLDRYEATLELHQRMIRAADLPYAQGLLALAAAEQDRKRLQVEPLTEPFLVLMPATIRAREAQLRIERRLAALQAIEAYRSANATLKALAPVDPVTGKPFTMNMTAKGFILELPPFGIVSRPIETTRYEIELVR